RAAFQSLRPLRSFDEHLGPREQRVDLSGETEETQPVAGAQDRVGGRIRHRLTRRARDGDDGHPEALAYAHLAQRLVHEVATSQADLAELGQPRLSVLRL